jgi:hypothetical protein
MLLFGTSHLLARGRAEKSFAAVREKKRLTDSFGFDRLLILADGNVLVFEN